MAESMEGVVTTDAEQPVENPAEKTITGKLLFHPWSTWSSLNAFVHVVLPHVVFGCVQTFFKQPALRLLNI
jgi:hypothetical protein